MFETQEDKVSCTVCGKVFSKMATLNVHMKSHIECKKCCKCFKKESELESHRLRMHASQTKSEDGVCHTKTKTEICEDCGHAASSRKSLMIHKENKSY